MESMFFRYRNLLLLLAILAAQIIGLAMQVHRTSDGRNTLDPQDGPGVRLIRLWAVAMIAPPEQLIHSSKMGLAGLWQNYLILHNVREQNQELQRTIGRLRLEQAALLEDARQGQRLQGMVNFQQKYIYKTLAAQAFGSSGSDQSRVFFLDKGSDDGLERDMAVVTADGIVGKVRLVFKHTAQVLAINDQSSGAGVILETTRIRGILRGNAAGQPQIVGILADQRIKPGEKVITAGGDQIFPRGLPVGVVEKVVRDPERDAFIDVIVKPVANLDRLDEVLVITSTQPRFSPEEQQDMATSEMLKGPEAAAIKEQQKASQIMAERLPGLTEPNAPAPGQAGSPAPGASAAQPAKGQDKGAATAPVVPPAPKLLHAQHPDRFSQAASLEAAPESQTNAKPKPAQTTKPKTPTGASGQPAPKAGSKPGNAPKPQQNKPQETEQRRKP